MNRDIAVAIFNAFNALLNAHVEKSPKLDIHMHVFKVVVNDLQNRVLQDSNIVNHESLRLYVYQAMHHICTEAVSDPLAAERLATCITCNVIKLGF